MKRHLRTVFLASLAILTATAFEGVAFKKLQESRESSITAGKESVTLPSFYLKTTTRSVDDDNSPGKARLSLCCHIGTFLTGNDCVQSANETEASLPMIYEVDLAPTNIFANDDHFSILVWNPCAGGNRYNLNPHLYKDEQWYLLSNGSVYRPETEVDEDRFLNYDQYCLARVRNYDYPEYLVFFCEEMYPDDEEPVLVMTSFGMMASVPFLIVTFVVYWLLPELKNIHGLTLRGYVGCLAMAYSTLTLVQLASQDWISYDGCIAIGIATECDFFFFFFCPNLICRAVNARRIAKIAENVTKGRLINYGRN